MDNRNMTYILSEISDIRFSNLQKELCWKWFILSKLPVTSQSFTDKPLKHASFCSEEYLKNSSCPSLMKNKNSIQTEKRQCWERF